MTSLFPPPPPPLTPPAPITEPSLRAIDEDQLDRQLERFEGLVPPVIGKLLAYTQRPGSLHYRLPIALLFIVGGCAGFLPILGFWMVPFGVLLIVQDVRPLRPTLGRGLAFVSGILERHGAKRPQARPRRCVTERAVVACLSGQSREAERRSARDARDDLAGAACILGDGERARRGRRWGGLPRPEASETSAASSSLLGPRDRCRNGAAR